MASGKPTLFQILLVVVLGGIESCRRNDLGNHRLAILPGFVQTFLRELRRRFLLRTVKENGRPVLRTPVGSLAVELGGIVILPKDFQQLLVRNFRPIVLHLNRFRVPGVVVTHVLVGWVGHSSAGVAYAG